MKDKYHVIVYELTIRDAGRGFIIEWRNRNIFYNTLFKWKLTQDDTVLYEGSNYWVRIDGLRGNAKAILTVVSRKGKRIDLSGKFLKIMKTGWWKRGVDYEINKIDERFVEKNEIDKEMKSDRIKIDTTGEWFLALTKVGMIAAGGILLWRKLKK